MVGRLRRRQPAFVVLEPVGVAGNSGSTSASRNSTSTVPPSLTATIRIGHTTSPNSW